MIAHDKQYSLYVSEFTYDNGDHKLAKNTTREFESEIINLSCFTILERRYNADLFKHLTDEDRLIGNMKNTLQRKGADGIIFGKIIEDVNGDFFTVEVSIVLFNGEKLFSHGIDVVRDDLNNPRTRREKLKELASLIAAKKKFKCDYFPSPQPSPINPWKPKPTQAAGFIVGGGSLLASLITKVMSDKSYDMHKTATDQAEKQRLYDKAVRLKNISINTFYVGVPVLSGTGLWYGIGRLNNSKNRIDSQPINNKPIVMQHQIGIIIYF